MNPECERCLLPVQSRSSLFCFACSQKHKAECDKLMKKIRAKEARDAEKRKNRK